MCRLLKSRNRRILSKRGEIQQHRVFTEHPAARPARLQHKTQVRFTHNVPGTELHHGFSACWLNIETDIAQERISINRESRKVTLGSQLHTDLFGTHIAKLKQRNVGTKRLIQSRFKRDVAQPQRFGICRS